MSAPRGDDQAQARARELAAEPLGFSSPEPVSGIVEAEAAVPVFVEPAAPPVVDVTDLDWTAIRDAAVGAAGRAGADAVLARAERMLDEAERRPTLLFDGFRADATDRAIHVAELDPGVPLWFIGDLHGDLLALEAALALAARDAAGGAPPRLVFLGDLFDDGGQPVELLLRVLALAADAPGRVCILAGNHDEALGVTGGRFTSTVSPSDFADGLEARPDDAVARRAALLAIRLFARAPRALWFPDGLLVAHGGIPLADLHPALREGLDWNDPRCLQDFTWTRAHPRARRKLPNRASRGSQFGHEDFADFCAVSAGRGRPVRRMVRGHDHEEERWAMPRAWAAHPLLTTVALSRRLPREAFGPDVRVPTVARWVPGTLPQVHRLHLPEAHVRELFAADLAADVADVADVADARDA